MNIKNSPCEDCICVSEWWEHTAVSGWFLSTVLVSVLSWFTFAGSAPVTDSSSPAQQLLTRAADLVALEKQATEVDVSCTLYCSFFPSLFKLQILVFHPHYVDFVYIYIWMIVPLIHTGSSFNPHHPFFFLNHQVLALWRFQVHNWYDKDCNCYLISKYSLAVIVSRENPPNPPSVFFFRGWGVQVLWEECCGLLSNHDESWLLPSSCRYRWPRCWLLIALGDRCARISPPFQRPSLPRQV